MPTPEQLTQLEKLAELRAEGILTAEEYQTKKAAVLAVSSPAHNDVSPRPPTKKTPKETAQKRCQHCAKRGPAHRAPTTWGAVDLWLLFFTLGFWLLVKLAYQTVAKPWRCETCGKRVESVAMGLGKSAAIGTAAMAVASLAVGYISHALGQNERTHAEARRKQSQFLQEQFDENSETILAGIKAQIDDGKYEQAAAEAAKFIGVATNPADHSMLTELSEHAQSRSAEEARKTLLSNTLSEAKALPASDIDGNKTAWGKLHRLEPGNATYKKKFEHYSAKVAARDKERQVYIAKHGKAPKRSGWDGSYYEVKQYLEDIARDPDSLDIDACTKVYKNKGGWLVGCDYRGRNGFWGMTRQSNWFTIRHGQVIKMHAANAYTP